MSRDPDLFSFRPRHKGPVAKVRATDPDTSVDAADSVSRIMESQRHILGVLRSSGPLTDEQIYARISMPMSPSGARSRRHELVERGLVIDSGERGKTVSGRKTIMWKAL